AINQLRATSDESRACLKSKNNCNLKFCIPCFCSLLAAHRSSLLCSYCLSILHKCFLALLNHLCHLSLEAVIENFLIHDRTQQAGIGRVHVAIELGFKVANLIYWKIIKDATGSGKDD